MSDETQQRQWRAIADLYHGFTTGFILTLVSRRDTDSAARMMFRTFRRQHEDLFLPALKKLGISGLPDAVKAAQYHYLSNKIGGVKVEYMFESNRKAWVRFPPPRWIYDGNAMCGVPTEVSRGVLRGWYAQNGVSLGNPRLGFVCTSQGTDAQHGLSGYFYEYDHDLTEEQRLIFSPGEETPVFDPEAAPWVDAIRWPEGRLLKAHRNYSMNYTRTILSESAALFGPAEASYLGRVTGQLIGMQYFDRIKDAFGMEETSPKGFAAFLASVGASQDDKTEIIEDSNGIIVRQHGWRLMRGHKNIPRSAFEAWNGLWEGALSAHNRFLVLETLRRMDYGDDYFEWRIRERQQSRL